jgi:hypothetical protein
LLGLSQRVGGDPALHEIVELDRNRLLIELMLLSEDDSTLEIDDEGRPVFAPYVEPERQRIQRRALHDGIGASQRHVNAYRLAAPDDADLAGVDGEVGRRIIERFVVEPTEEEARTFGDWEPEDDYNHLEMVISRRSRAPRRAGRRRRSRGGGRCG